MKLTALSTASLAALAGLVTTASAAQCVPHNNMNGMHTYVVIASGVDDVPGYCRGLWDHLGSFKSCVASDTRCDNSNGYLHWQFTVGQNCDGGYVDTAWSRATKNEFGRISCA